MKHVILSLIITVFYTSVYSQSLVMENKIWSNVRHPTEYGYDFDSHYIKFLGDTIISENLYKKVYRSNDSLMIDWFFEGSIRETDTGSVYYIPMSSEEENLLYDFGVKEGDSTEINGDPYRYLYSDSIRIKPFGIYNELRKYIYLSDGYHNVETWIEGVGSRHGILLFPKEFLLVGEVFNLVCFYENDSLKFHNDYYSSCFPSGKYSLIERTISNPHVSISNLKDVLIFDLKMINYESVFRLVDLSGRTLWTQKIPHESIISLDKSKYENGIYIFVIQSANSYHCGKIIMN